MVHVDWRALQYGRVFRRARRPDHGGVRAALAFLRCIYYR